MVAYWERSGTGLSEPPSKSKTLGLKGRCEKLPAQGGDSRGSRQPRVRKVVFTAI